MRGVTFHCYPDSPKFVFDVILLNGAYYFYYFFLPIIQLYNKYRSDKMDKMCKSLNKTDFNLFQNKNCVSKNFVHHFSYFIQFLKWSITMNFNFGGWVSVECVCVCECVDKF